MNKELNCRICEYKYELNGEACSSCCEHDDLDEHNFCLNCGSSREDEFGRAIDTAEYAIGDR